MSWCGLHWISLSWLYRASWIWMPIFSPILERFQPLKKNKLSVLFSLFSCVRTIKWVVTFLKVSHKSLGFLYSFFCCCFSSSKLQMNIIKSIDSFFCLIRSAVKPLKWIFQFRNCVFQLQNFLVLFLFNIFYLLKF